MKKQVVILTPSFYDFDLDKLKIGGVETYVKDLSKLIIKLGHECQVIQFTESGSREAELDGITIKELQKNGSNQTCFDQFRINNPDAYVIIATDQMTIKDSNPRTMQIQHGIAFDIPQQFIKGFWKKSGVLIHVNKLLRCIKNIRRLYQVPTTVCVDYNYFNWFRTLGIISEDRLVRVIPNYTSNSISQAQLDDKLRKYGGVKNIIFARRFVDYRGTLLFSEVAQKLLIKYPELNITFAGSGPLKNHIEDMFKSEPRVHITSFSAYESVKYHYNFDVAVVPTIFSEGTSLSLCEAMAAGCLVIATHVGGITNIILDSHNGLLAYPDAEDFFNTVEKAINMSKSKFQEIVKNGYDSALNTFSLSHWQSGWEKLLSVFLNK